MPRLCVPHMRDFSTWLTRSLPSLLMRWWWWQNPERWRNPLMGYVSSADPASNLKMKFQSKEEALNYVEKMGERYFSLAGTVWDQ